MRRVIYPCIIAVLGFVSCNQANKADQLPEPKPNVLFISIDDLNTWLGALGGFSNAKTPNIDKLAAQGVIFSNAHCQAPLCGPSRASIMTGLRPSTTGIYGMIGDDNIRLDNPVTEQVTFLPEFFGQQGYHTMGIGKLFHSHAPEGLFDESGGRVPRFGPYPKKRFVWEGFAEDRENYGRTNTDWGAFPESDMLMPDHQASNWIIERLKKEYDKPFFMAVGYQRPHVPLYVPQKWFDMHPLEGIETPPYQADDMQDVPEIGQLINYLPMMPTTDWAIESGEWPKIVQAYQACVSFVDNEVGRVLDALEKSGHADNTVIVLWSDHGYRLGEKGTFAKHALWDPATKAPLLFAAPGLPKGKVIDEPVEMLSIYPTLLELCGLPANKENEGKSLVDLMQGNADDNSVAITTFGMNNHTVRSADYRYIRYENGGEEFYDYTTDPNEWVNQVANKEYAAEIDKLRRLLPSVNRPWATHSNYKFQKYFVDQKVKTSLSSQ
ncbi:MAG: sulfatase [Cyclobacteriaceae bacterium]